MDNLKKQLLRLTKVMQWYHRYELIGDDVIPKEGPALLAVNHSLATYDGILMGAAVYEKTGRMAYGLADRHFFRFSALGEVSQKVNLVEGNHENAKDLIRQGELLAVAPGGMREAIRGSEEKGQILWGKRLGFAKLAYTCQVPVILAACPAADDIYEVKTGGVTEFFYENFKLPVVLAKGLGPTLIPRPVKLRTYLSGPYHPPKMENGEFCRKDLLKFHHFLVTEMQNFMDSVR